MRLKIFTLIVMFLMFACNVYSQDNKTVSDSTHGLKNYAKYETNSKFTTFMYNMVLKLVIHDSSEIKKNKELKQDSYSIFEGKIIRNIIIETLDPFRNSIVDTTVSPKGFIARVGNSLHIKTRENSIRNLLLISKNQPLEAILVTESERLVRSMNYITDVSFHVEMVPNQPDSVDVFIRELDKWSFIPFVSNLDSRATFNITENNMLGLGHKFYNNLVWDYSTDSYVFMTKYFIPNISNTFINSTLQYGNDEYGNSIKSFALNRSFFSPITKWIGGIILSQHQHSKTFWSNNNMYFKYNKQDYWAGVAIPFNQKNTNSSGITNYVSAFRFIKTRFLEKPLNLLDTLNFYTDEQFYLASLGISSRLYVKDKYIFKFGTTEDVPVGKVISLTGGFRKKNNVGSIYIGGRISWGNYYSWGFLSSNIEYGTFLGTSKVEKGAFIAEINYFTKLIKINRWKIRQFIKPQLVIGANLNEHNSLILNNEYTIREFDNPLVFNTHRLLLTSQTQLYAPWNFIGFQFGPYMAFSLGMLGDAINGFRKSQLYAHISLGILIKNNNLAINTFQIAFSFYPIIPDEGLNIFKFNSYQTTDFDFQDFETGKPILHYTAN
ncbi:MAG: hypothetical protein PHE33_04275 [Bacteroidales bacterium]|nr:hypothetical protein [Bacteroidales bacterium]